MNLLESLRAEGLVLFDELSSGHIDIGLGSLHVRAIVEVSFGDNLLGPGWFENLVQGLINV